MSIQNEINRINNDVDTQTDLITSIKSALEGKAAGGDGGNGSGDNETICTITLSTKPSNAPDQLTLIYYNENSELVFDLNADALNGLWGNASYTFECISKGYLTVICPYMLSEPAENDCLTLSFGDGEQYWIYEFNNNSTTANITIS